MVIVIRELFGGGGEGTSVEILSKFSSCVEIRFAENEDFSKIFEILLHRTPQKPLFIAFLLTNFPKIHKKSAQKFLAAPSAPKTCRNTPIFRPLCVDGPP